MVRGGKTAGKLLVREKAEDADSGRATAGECFVGECPASEEGRVDGWRASPFLLSRSRPGVASRLAPPMMGEDMTPKSLVGLRDAGRPALLFEGEEKGSDMPLFFLPRLNPGVTGRGPFVFVSSPDAPVARGPEPFALEPA